MQQTVFLDNVPVKRRGKKDVLVLPAGTPGSVTAVKGSGAYFSGPGVQARVNWGTSTTTEWLTGV
ncbi:hypothetical protein PY257_07555 [Ramlibacter sp. H39-3-26]|uniref:hypothetical protein n=1 Tax=Curvibacter soli TaxID=3031331 RepID=UPI0023D9B7B5|nr:hypothetical protein [Ramlibacter sp. H39-3-26]MDF1485039.1 hypothetical protein [Ramlibacter sp. H39-3-26]